MAEEEKIVDLDSFKKEQKKRERKKWFSRKIEAIVNWIKGDSAAIIIPAIATAIGFLIRLIITLVKSVSKSSSLKKQAELKDLYCYDRSLGHYWKLRRKLTNNDWVEINKRKKNGEKLADILSELKVLA